MGAGRPCDRAAEAVPVEHPAVVRRTIASAQTPLRLLGVGVMALHGIRAIGRPQGSLFRGRLSTRDRGNARQNALVGSVSRGDGEP